MTPCSNIMLDLEAMGTSSDAAIVAIGAVEIDFYTDSTVREFYMPVRLSSSVASGGKMDPDTVVWWLGQEEAARKEVTREDSAEICVALQAFSRWVAGVTASTGHALVWGNGADFDNVILRTAYRRYGLDAPWDTHRHNRCYRTVKSLCPDIPPPEFVGTRHNALSDAVYQAQHLIAIMKRLCPAAQVTR